MRALFALLGQIVAWLVRITLTALLTAILIVGILGLAARYGQLLAPSSDFSAFYEEFAQPLLRYVADILKSLFPWPFVVLLGLALVYFSPHALSALVGLMRLFRKISLFGAEFELTEQARQQIRAAASDLNDALGKYRKEVDIEVARWTRQLDLDRKLERLVEEKLKPSFKDKKLPTKFRCTIHVPDFVLDGHLYQLLDYYPSGGGSARFYSERFGIIGKVWRSEIPQVVGNLLPGQPSDMSEEEKVSRIMRDWGMNFKEARSALEKPSYACCGITFDDRKLGVLYMDSIEPHAFSAEDEDKVLAQKFEAAVQQSGIPKAISELMREVEKISLGIRIA